MTHEFTEKNISDYLETTDSYELLKFAIDRLYYNNEFDNYNDLKTWVAEQITPYVNNPDIRNELDFNNLLGSLNSLNDRNMIYDLIEEVDNKTLKTFTDNYLNVRTVGVISNDLRKTIANQVTEFVNIPRIENQIEFANFFDSLVEVYDKNTKAYNNFINNTIDERNIYDLLEGYENDKLRLFATEYLNYNDEFDDYDTLKGWIASQLKEYMNNIENKEDFNIGRPLNTLVDKITNDKKELNNLIDDRINKGWFKDKMFNNLFPLSVNLRKMASKFNKNDFNRIGNNYYMTKDKNIFIKNYNELAREIPGLKDYQDNCYNEVKNTFDKGEVITIDLDVNDYKTNINLKALSDLLENYLQDGTIKTTDRYYYKFYIEGRWKSFTLKSMEDWNKLINRLENGSLVFNIETFSELFWTNEFYNQDDQILPDLSIIQKISIEPVKILNQRGDNSGEFFQYRIKDEYLVLEPILIKAQIFNTINP